MQKELILVALAALALGACERRLDTSSTVQPARLAAAGTAGNLIGTVPAPPTTAEGVVETTPIDPNKPLTETPQTTSTAEASKELSKTNESQGMPLPGQPNDHSNVDPAASQKSGQGDAPPSGARAADTPERT